MVKVRNDLTNKTFYRLKVIKQVDDYITPKGQHSAKWLCKCECGNIVEVVGDELKKGNTKSCGCWRKERITLCNKKYNDYEVQEDYVIIYTSKGEPFFVDLEDFWRVKNTCWWMDSKGYIKGKSEIGEVALHRFIMNCPDNLDVDHKRGKKSRNDNRKENLRIATISQNGMNVGLRTNNISGTTGVCWNKANQKWQAYITVNYNRNFLGHFDIKEEAIRARKEAEEKYFGEYSYDNSQK